jgi:integrase
MAKALTQVSIANLKPAASRREVADGKVAGLYLVIQPSGSASWAVRYRASGAPRKLTLGPSPALDLAAARRAAQRALAEIAEGRDPAAMKRATRVAQREQASAITNTVATVTELFVSRYAKAKNKSWAETERLLGKEVVSRWGHRPLATITRAQVHDLLDAIVDRPAPIIANRVLAAFRKLCNWSVERGIIDSSPCEKLRPPGKENRRDRILSDDEVRRVWIASISLGYPFGPIVRLLLLTGQRREEVAQMRWNEVDLKSRIWTIPKERAKNGVEHQVPLSNPAIALLSDLPRISGGMDWIFTTTGITPPSGFSRAKTNLDESGRD